MTQRKVAGGIRQVFGSGAPAGQKTRDPVHVEPVELLEGSLVATKPAQQFDVRDTSVVRDHVRYIVLGAPKR
jgi:hypothetical protein